MNWILLFVLLVLSFCSPSFGQSGTVGYNRTSKITAPSDLHYRGASFSASGSGSAGYFIFGEGSSPSLTANKITLYAPADVEAGGSGYVFPGTAATGFWLSTAASGVGTFSIVSYTGGGNVVRATSPTLVTPEIGVATATTPSLGDDSTRVATTASVQNEIDPYRYEWIGAEFEGHGDVIESGKESDPIYFDRACTIVEWVLTADQSGSFIVDILKEADAWNAATPPAVDNPPADADTICGSARPTLSSQRGVRQTDLSGFTSTAISAGDTIVFKADSASTTLTRASVLIRVRY